jgi:benzoylformate decarboxylase
VDRRPLRGGALFVVLANGRNAVLDRLAEQHGGKPPRPDFEEIDVAGRAQGLGCPVRRIDDYADLCATLDALCPGLADPTEPLLLEVAVTTDDEFRP